MKANQPLKLNRNENPYGPAPAVMRAIKNFPRQHAFMYLKGYYNSRLVGEISRQFKVTEDRIILYYGIEDFIRNLFGQLNPQKDSILTNENCFAYFDIFAAFKKIKIHHFKLYKKGQAFESDIVDCLSKIKKYRPKVVIITTPNNPTGHQTSFKDIERIIKATPRDSYLLIDETYFGLYPNTGERMFRKILNQYPNVAFLRTFSKFYGLAGLRVGFGFCGQGFKKMIDYNHRFLNFSRVLEEAGIAALKSKTFYRKVSQKICRDRDWFIKKVNQLEHFRAYKSAGNFVLVESFPRKIRLLERAKENQKIIIWKSLNKKSFRVSIGLSLHVKLLLGLLKKIDAK